MVGLGDLLYLGQDGASQIVHVKKSNGDFISAFASPGGVRDEGLECDPVSFFPTLALWSRDVSSFVAGIEVESGTCVCTISVKIDLKPGSNPNCVNPNSHGNVAVAIFGSPTFDVSLIDTSTVRFGGAPAKRCKVSDVEMEGPKPGEFMPPDGIPDLVCDFDTDDVPWPSPGSNCGTLQITGMLSDGRPIAGSDTACLPGEAACEAGTPLPLP